MVWPYSWRREGYDVFILRRDGEDRIIASAVRECLWETLGIADVWELDVWLHFSDLWPSDDTTSCPPVATRVAGIIRSGISRR